MIAPRDQDPPAFVELYPEGVAAAALRDFTAAAPLWRAEEPAVANAVPKRAREFAAGRDAARRALGRLGERPCAIVRRADRTPEWPAGTVGDISHAPGYCGAVVGYRSRFRGLGLDVERADAIGHSLRELIASPREWEGLAAGGDPPRGTVLFSGKEAFYKAQYAITRAWLDFADVELRLVDESRFELVATASTPAAVADLLPTPGAYRIADGYVFAAVAFLA